MTAARLSTPAESRTPALDLDVLVIGAGSIGSRHARNLSSLGARVQVTDVDLGRAASVEGAVARSFDLDDLGSPDAIVIASPTRFHATHLRAALATGARVLVEKPFALPDDDLDDLVGACDGRVMVGYNLRLHEPLVRLAATLAHGRAGGLLAARLWFGSWLPDWRPNVDYRETYSARRDLGGGVLLDAIHELDEAIWLWGTDLAVVGAVVDRVGPLDIDVEDTVRALLRTRSGAPVDIALDYLSRRYRRGIEVTGTEATIRYDWATSDLTIETAQQTHREQIATPVSQSYEREAERFVQFVREGTAPPVDAAGGAASVKLAGRIQQVAALQSSAR